MTEVSLAKRSLAGSIGVLLSRLSGIVRSIVLSASFGAGLALDAFFIALRVPSSLRDLLADGALSSAATTVLTESESDSKRFATVFNQILVAFLVVTLFLAAMGSVFSDAIVAALVDANYSPQGTAQAVAAFRILAFYLPIAMWSALCMAVLSIRGALLRATFASSFFNFGTVFGAMVLSPMFADMGRDRAEGLSWGTFLGGIVQCVYLSWPLMRTGDLTLATLREASLRKPFWLSRDVGRVFALILPRTVGQGALVIGMMVSTFYATSLGTGYLTYLTNALIIILVPVGLFGVAGGYAALPLLSRSRHEGNVEVFWRTLDEGLWLVTFLSAASVTGLALLADPLLILVFEHGSFGRHDVIVNASAVIAMLGSIVFSSQNKIQTQALFSIRKTTFVAVNSFLYIGVLVVGYSLTVARFGIVGMGFSTVLASAASWMANAVALKRYALKNDQVIIPLVTKNQVFLVTFALFSIGVGLFLRQSVLLDFVSDRQKFSHVAAALMVFVGASGLGVIWFGLLFVAGPPELRRRALSLLRNLRGRFSSRPG
jgi:putative peptidoglycan lipid II flippase